MSGVIIDLKRESDAAQSLLANLRDILAGDEAATSDAVEGETNLLEAISAAVNRLGEIAAHRDGLKDYFGKVKSRLDRLDQQEDLIRTALMSAIAATGLKKVETATATLSLKAVAPKALILSEADIPSQFWKPSDPKLDRAGILEALKNKQTVPGAELSNGGQSLQVRFG